MDALLIGTLTTAFSPFVCWACKNYFTRKNLISIKLVDSITSHRITWINTIPNEFAHIISNINSSLNDLSIELDAKNNEYRDLTNDPEYQSKRYWNLSSVYTSIAFNVENTKLSCSDLIFKLNLLKLRMNPYEDTEIINLINYYITFYTDEQQKFEDDIQVAKENATLLMTHFPLLIKKEWEKVKNESYGEIKDGWIKNLFNKLLVYKRRIFEDQHKPDNGFLF